MLGMLIHVMLVNEIKTASVDRWMDCVLIPVLSCLFLVGYSHRRQCSGSREGAQAEANRGVQQDRCQIGYHLPQQEVQKIGFALQHSTTHVNKHRSTAYLL